MPLTRRQRELVALLIAGPVDDQALADALCVTVTTAHWHLGNVMAKLEVHTRAAVISYAVNHGTVVDGLWQPT